MRGVAAWSVVFLGIGLAVGARTLLAESAEAPLAPRISRAKELSFRSPPQIPSLSSAWAVGEEGGSGLYVLRVRLAPGGVIPPHTHPDDRVTTVISGKLSVGFGDVVDTSRAQTAGAGDSYVVAAGQPHFLVAQQDAVEYQEVGHGRTGTQMIIPPEAR